MDQTFAFRIELARQFRQKSHRADPPAEEASLEERKDQERNPQKKRSAKPHAGRRRAKETQDGTEPRKERRKLGVILWHEPQRQDD